MFVRCKMRRKDGKEHRYWSVVENVRVRGGRVVQRQVLYLGEINDSQRAASCRSIAVLDETAGARLARSGYALSPKARGGDSLILIVAVDDVRPAAGSCAAASEGKIVREVMASPRITSGSRVRFRPRTPLDIR